jgi:hypothetical protein
MEKRVVAARMVPINPKKPKRPSKMSALSRLISVPSRFLRRHPYLYSIVATIAAFAVISIAVTLIQSVSNGPPVPPPPIPPVPAPTYHPPTASPSPSPSPTSDSPITLAPPAPQPPPVPAPPASTQASSGNTLSQGDCAAGDFNSSDPSAVQKVSCSSDNAYEVLDTFDGNDESACEEVQGAEFAYIQEVQELENGVVVSTTYTTLCMGRL